MTRYALIATLLSAGFINLGCAAGGDGNAEELEEVDAPLTFINQPGTTTPYFYDGGSAVHFATGNWGHICPNWTVMTGVQLAKNVYKCAQMPGANAGWGSGGATYWEASNQRNGMLSCPYNYLMTGYFPGAINQHEMLRCSSAPAPLAGEYVDAGTQDSFPMHVCREDSADPYRFGMTGIHASNNRFSCAR